MTRIRGAKSELVVTGMPGVGKTVLLDHLTGKAYKPGYAPPPKRSFDVEPNELLRSRKRVALSVIPGQDAPQRHDGLTDLFEGKRPIDGLIHVVCNGFTFLREPEARAVLVEERGLDTLERFREVQLADEIDDFHETADALRRSLRKHRNQPWLLLVVDKLDLFSEKDERFRARKHYGGRGGEFSKATQELLAHVGSDNLVIDVLPACAWLEDFSWGNETVSSTLKPDQRDALILHLLGVLDEYTGRR